MKGGGIILTTIALIWLFYKLFMANKVKGARRRLREHRFCASLFVMPLALLVMLADYRGKQELAALDQQLMTALVAFAVAAVWITIATWGCSGASQERNARRSSRSCSRCQASRRRREVATSPDSCTPISKSHRRTENCRP